MHKFQVATLMFRCLIIGLSGALMCSPSYAEIKTDFNNIEPLETETPVDIKVDAKTEAHALVVGDIYIDNQNIFNPKHQKESGLLYRAANALHMTTRVSVVEKYLLFKRGDVFSERLLNESERLLRSSRNLQDALITYKTRGQTVDVYIATQDTWSLKPKVNYSHKGGVNKSELGVEEDNLLGLGIRTSISHLSDGERTSKILKINDDNLLGQWHSLGIIYVNSSDGSQKGLSFARPFYALDTRNTYGFNYDNLDEEDIVYDYGKEQYRYRSRVRVNDVFWGWSKGLKSYGVVRHGFGLFNEDNRYKALPNYLPPDDDPLADDSAPASKVSDNNPALALSSSELEAIYLPHNYHSFYPYYRIDFLQDNYQKVINFERIGKTEDIYLGFKAGLQLGYGAESWDNDQDRSYFKIYAEKALFLAEDKLMFLNADLEGRYAYSNNAILGEAPNNGFQNVLSSASVRYYHTQSDHFKGYVDFYAWSTLNADKRDSLYLDPETGLRAYPLYYLSGTHLQKISIEERFYSNAYWLQIFKVGAAVFFDAGRLSGNINSEKDGVYKAVGFGLRLSNNRSSKGDVIHIDLSYPLDIEPEDQGWKFSIESRASF